MTSPPLTANGQERPLPRNTDPAIRSDRSTLSVKAANDHLTDPTGVVRPVEVRANLHLANGGGTQEPQKQVPAPANVTASLDDTQNTLNRGLEGLEADGGLRIPSAPSSQGDAGNRTLYLGNLHPFVSEDTLREVFNNCEGVTELKVIRDKVTQVSAGYGFARFSDQDAAAAALEKVGKCVLFGQEARINWAFQREQQETLVHHVHIFVGDLSPEITDAALVRAFHGCPGCSDARVQWDHATGRSRGYGFVSFRTREDAESAIAAMHGQVVGGRRIRCGWAQHKADPVIPLDQEALDRADPTNTNVYVGNLSPSLTDGEVRRSFGAYGPIAEVKLHRKGAFGFVRFRYHNDAVKAILGMNGVALDGKPVKCSWGRHPAVLPSGMQANLMLAAAAGMGPLAMQATPVVGVNGGVMGMPMAGNAAAAMVQSASRVNAGMSVGQFSGNVNDGGAHGMGDVGLSMNGGHGTNAYGPNLSYVPPGVQYGGIPQLYYARSPGVQLQGA
jgi:nucleolysin TIA-1/TIAR